VQLISKSVGKTIKKKILAKSVDIRIYIY